jgi:hypothetical protein
VASQLTAATGIMFGVAQPRSEFDCVLLAGGSAATERGRYADTGLRARQNERAKAYRGRSSLDRLQRRHPR